MTSLVSCIMATKNRPAFLRQAIRYFLDQTYTHSELVIVDDSDWSCEPLIPDVKRIHYIRLSAPRPLGEKLNIGIERSSGDIVQKLDDDDYYHPDFIANTAATLLAHGVDRSIVAMGTFLVLVVGHRDLYDAGSGWFAGGTYCFSRKAWERKPFRSIPIAEDISFLEDHPELQPVSLSNKELYLMVRHGRHTWNELLPVAVVPFFGDEKNVTKFFTTRERYYKTPAELLGCEANAFYESLGESHATEDDEPNGKPVTVRRQAETEHAQEG